MARLSVLSDPPAVACAERFAVEDELLGARMAAAVSGHVAHWAVVARLHPDAALARQAAFAGCVSALRQLGDGFSHRLANTPSAAAFVSLLSFIGCVDDADEQLVRDLCADDEGWILSRLRRLTAPAPAADVAPAASPALAADRAPTEDLVPESAAAGPLFATV